jgi:hypothetical protein
VSPRDQPRNLTSLSLLERVKADDQQAWQRLVGLYSPLVCHWCARWQVTGADADDIVQDVFLAVAAGIEKFQRPRRAVGAVMGAAVGAATERERGVEYPVRRRQRSGHRIVPRLAGSHYP